MNYARLRTDVGGDFTTKYRSLAVATALAKRTKGVQGHGDLGRDYQTGFWCRSRCKASTTNLKGELVSGIADFMKANQVAAIDLYQNPASQRQLAVFLKERKASPALIAETKKSVQFGERLKKRDGSPASVLACATRILIP